MRILPPTLHPWRARIDRRHHPPAAEGREGYRQYRQCLRWEFGFTCPFCLCHEADLALDGAERAAITQIEHWIPASDDAARINVYSNCLYICRYCNRSRGATPVIEVGGDGRLLNPCEDIWERSFSLENGRIEPRINDPAVLYTLAVYDLNDPRKVRRRLRRQERIRERLDFIDRARTLRERLLGKAMRALDPELVDVASLLEEQLRQAWQDLGRYQAVPEDARCPCACDEEELCALPRVLEEQTIELEPPFVERRLETD